MKNNCFIVKDLMPLYTENLLSEETTQWVKNHLDSCEECRSLVEISSMELTTEPIESTMNQEVMFKKINRRLSMYQIVFVAFSFLIALNTSLLKGSWGFVLWCPILGATSYLFYKDMKLVFLLSFLPIFLWSYSTNLKDFFYGYHSEVTLISFLFKNILYSIVPSIIHFIFALLGGIIGLLIELIKLEK